MTSFINSSWVSQPNFSLASRYMLIVSALMFAQYAHSSGEAGALESLPTPSIEMSEVEVAKSDFALVSRPASNYDGHITLSKVTLPNGGDPGSDTSLSASFFITGATSFKHADNSLTECEVHKEYGFEQQTWAAQCRTPISNADQNELGFTVQQTERGTGPSQYNDDELVNGFWYTGTVKSLEGEVSLGKLFVPDVLSNEIGLEEQPLSSPLSLSTVLQSGESSTRFEILGLAKVGGTAPGSSIEISGTLASVEASDTGGMGDGERSTANEQSTAISIKTSGTASKAANTILAAQSNAAKNEYPNANLPLRVYDSRSDSRGKLAAGETRTVSMAACKPIHTVFPTLGARNSPFNVNVTTVAAAGKGYLTVYRGSDNDRVNIRPNITSLSYGRLPATAANITAWPKHGTLKVYSSQSTHVIIDCFLKTLYQPFANGGTTQMGKVLLKEQKRIYDTRRAGVSALKPNQPRLVKVVGSMSAGGITSGFSNFPVDYAIVNLTAVRAKGSGFITAYRPNTSQPSTSNLNFIAGAVQANRAIVPVSSTGYIVLSTSKETDVIVDVIGWVTAAPKTNSLFTKTNYVSDFYVLHPPMRRSFDSRLQGNGQRLSNSQPHTVTAKTYTTTDSLRTAEVTITVTNAAKAGSLTVSQRGARRPATSVVNYVPGHASTNTIDIPVDSLGRFDIHLSSPAHVIVDVITQSF